MKSQSLSVIAVSSFDEFLSCGVPIAIPEAFDQDVKDPARVFHHPHREMAAHFGSLSRMKPPRAGAVKDVVLAYTNIVGPAALSSRRNCIENASLRRIRGAWKEWHDQLHR
jgi:hypothetical protein